MSIVTSIDWENEEEVHAFLREGLLLANQPTEEPMEDFALSRRYLRWERRFLSDPFGYARRRRRPVWQKVSYRAAMIILIVGLIFGALMFNPTVRAGVTQWFKKVFQTQNTYHFGGGADVQPTGKWQPAYLPEGYAEVEYVDLLNYFVIYYEDGAGNEISLSYQPISEGNTFHIDNEGMDISAVAIAGNIGEAYQSTDAKRPNMVFWTDVGANTAFLLRSFEPCDTLIRIAESLVLTN